MTEEIKKQEIKIEIDEQTANGSYSNLALITHSETEFIIDFIFVQPQNGKAKVKDRIITSPLHVKKFLQALHVFILCSIALSNSSVATILPFTNVGS